MEQRYVFSRKDIDKFIKELILFDISKSSIAFFKGCIETLKITSDSLENKINKYYKMWRGTIDTMYSEEIPYQRNVYNIGLEFTPYTVYLAEIYKIDLCKSYDLSEDDKEYCLKVFNEKAKKYSFLNDIQDKINFILYIMIAPPLLALGDFYLKAYNEHITKASLILNVVQNSDIIMPSYMCNIGFGLANNFINQDIYEKYGKMDGLLSDVRFLSIKDKLEAIRRECGDNKILSKQAICPHCGKRHDLIVHKQDIFYAQLSLLHKDVLAQLGLLLMDEYRNMFGIVFLDSIIKEIQNINQVEEPKCYILVEGDTEEKAIPYMAIKYGKPLSIKKIKVWNSKTKEKVYMDFEKNMRNDPNAKMCVLLDGDAKKQIDDIERMIKIKKDKYALHYIPNGTFEDIIDKDVAIKALNNIYGDNVFCITGFDQNKPFLNYVEKKIHMDSTLGKFDKIKFIEEVLRLTTRENIPDIIKDLINDCYNLVG